MNYHLFQLVNDAAGRSAVLDHLMRFAALDLVFLVFSIAGAVVVHALLRRRFAAVVRFGAVLALAFGFAQLASHLSHEQRPFRTHAVHQLIPHAADVSLPSEHATAAFAIAFGLLAFVSRPAGLALLPPAGLIGFARVWTGLHYPGDILAAVGLAGLATLLVRVPRPAPAPDVWVVRRPFSVSSARSREPSGCDRR